jgi:hypothetical protein
MKSTYIVNKSKLLSKTILSALFLTAVFVVSTVASTVAIAQSTLPYQMPQRIKRGEGASALYLDKAAGSWQNCTSSEPGAQDSTCVVPYRYGVAAGLATINASFTKTSPFIGSTGTSPRWNTTNAISLTVSCTGVASYANANAPLQASPSGVTLNSATAGAVTCIFTAMNSDNEPTTVAITANFTAPIPPTLNVGFTRPNFDVGTGGSQIYWTSANAQTLYVSCSGYNWGPGYIALQGNPSGVTMERDTTGSIVCTFTATNEVGQTATQTAVANVTRPPPPSVNGAYSPANIEAGQQSQLLYSSANATVLNIVCNGLEFAAVQTPSMILNQPWYWFAQTWPNPGTQSCGIAAYNSLGEVAIVEFSLEVAPVGSWASGGGTSGMYLYAPGTPGVPDPTGPNANSGKQLGYIGPDGQLYRDAAGTEPCNGRCTSDGTPTNQNYSNPAEYPPYTGGGEGE